MGQLEFLINSVLYVVENIFTLIIKLLPIYVECMLEFFNLKQKPLKSIKNKVILITGGGQGLGKEIAIQLSRYDNQCKIIIADINLASANEVVNYLRINMYTKAYAFYVDVADYESVAELHKRIAAEIGIVDILINNAGLITFLSLMEKDWTDIEKVIDVNFKSHFIMTRLFLPDMIAQKSGHIVGLSSLAGSFPGPYRTVYSATKSGVDSFMKCLSTELLLDGRSDFIKTSLVCPYFILTRAEIKDAVEPYLSISALKPTDAADSIVDGILREREEIYVPKIFSVMKFVSIIPFKVYKESMFHLFSNKPALHSFRNKVF